MYVSQPPSLSISPTNVNNTLDVLRKNFVNNTLDAIPKNFLPPRHPSIARVYGHHLVRDPTTASQSHVQPAVFTSRASQQGLHLPPQQKHKRHTVAFATNSINTRHVFGLRVQPCIRRHPQGFLQQTPTKLTLRSILEQKKHGERTACRKHRVPLVTTTKIPDNRVRPGPQPRVQTTRALRSHIKFRYHIAFLTGRIDFLVRDTRFRQLLRINKLPAGQRLTTTSVSQTCHPAHDPNQALPGRYSKKSSLR
ncbi:hypothetical protein BBAD15_g12150 [Beauveria bassiana D1-5]|uniref:Uncharacterized protein n=1 Tax=Beauveria bassiana D1-5 TaxID=1245745 RepID=A0A0A2V4B9_BEABA|nr:hypothetical protein BBAD15_g12150 [Beauveria bassiana D1-5]